MRTGRPRFRVFANRPAFIRWIAILPVRSLLDKQQFHNSPERRGPTSKTTSRAFRLPDSVVPKSRKDGSCYRASVREQSFSTDFDARYERKRRAIPENLQS